MFSSIKLENACCESYLNNQVFQSVLVGHGVRREFRQQLCFGVSSQFINAIVAMNHTLESVLVCLARNENLLVNLQLFNLLLELLLDFGGSLLDKLVLFSLENPLAEHLGLECLLVGILAHHSLELKGI